MWNLLAWIVLGLIAGAIAKAIYPGHQGGGILATMILGIVGALVGGWLGSQLGIGGAGAAAAGALTLPGIIFAVLGAIIVLFLWGLFTRRTA
ncbi:GlsB/YeaQ/YmgE family stress response membrane protein [Chroococcidiopsis sp. CCMEE 29]|uniref:GlsB/YeaQ/YmgE family stress response membrane protein n=1 Tax=Chroococcidiopsis sp. CCMEE 29 TaxID=155894 RepID=UPI00201FE840|nr:GlsB/YeaQ/YmgE family stress response membrane protein [Chroococcidiopsis sp. CCMEE 29]